MSSVVYETQHSIRLGRSQVGSATAASFSLREQRRDTHETSTHIIPDRDSDSEQIEHRYIRHSRSFSNIDYVHQTEEAEMAGPQTPVSAAGREASMQQYTPNNARGRQMMPNSDSKYSSQTISARADNEKRLRAQRRKTDGSDEIQSLRRPSTSHGSSTMRKPTYSQYPDFENIKDPFAKRDKIPRKHRQPLPIGNDPDAASAADTARALDTEADKASAHASVAAVDHARKDSQEGVPTPLKKRDKIPRHAVNLSQQRQQPPLPSQLISPPATARAPVETLQMEPMDSPFPDSPVTPASQMPSVRSIDRSLIAETLISPVSLESPPSANNLRSQSSAPVSRNTNITAPVRTASLQPVNTNLAAAMTPVGTLSPRTNSPRMHIDMDKVETLYARQSMIFERNKQLRDSKMFSSSSSGSSNSRSFESQAASGKAKEQPPSGLRSMSGISEEHENDQTRGSGQNLDNNVNDNGNDDNDDDDDDDQHIPFDQVLIPTAFKRLRGLLEDPSFEIDDETYRRFKLSERWYAREERLQVEMAFNMGTFGESKRRERTVQKRPSEISHISSAGASTAEAPAGKAVQQEQPTMPSPAATDNKSVLPTLVESDNEQLGGLLGTQTTVPERRRKPTYTSEFNQSAMNDTEIVRYDTPDSYVPSVRYQTSYETDKAGYVPPEQPQPALIQPFGVQEPDFVPLRTHSRHADPRQQRYRREQQEQQQSSSPAQKKQALCGLCIIM
ncbi:hypothetical protein FB645_001919 [Coemansia sp. IMI 203386]|nr:hypothetical protein FB645_001919 [Coemansia sp. IMI 203386]